MKLKTILGVFVVCCTCLSVQAQQQFRVMEYNVENLFDCRHDSLKNDKEFLNYANGLMTHARNIDGSLNMLLKQTANRYKLGYIVFYRL